MRPMDRWLPILALVAAWVWTALAGGGGLLLLIQRGPWPLTNGWFALLSGIAACLATAWLCKRYLSITLSGWLRFTVAALFFVAGRVALLFMG